MSASEEAGGGVTGAVPAPAGYGRGAAVLSLGIGVTGLVTYTYFSLASHSLSDEQYGHISLLWSATFIVVSVLYRPVEQLLSRTIAERAVHGDAGTDHLRTAAKIQLTLGVAFAAAGLAARDPIQHDLLGGSAELYWILIVTILAYAASYFARGFLAGHRRFGGYGLLVLLEASTRCLFALAVAVGISEGETAVALGMAAAPIVSLAVVPFALRRGRTRAPEPAPAQPREEAFRPREFAAAVLLIMLAEQTFLNAGPLLVKATEGAEGAALAGFTFNVLLIARAPLQLFQSVQASILPHLTEAHATGSAAVFRGAVNRTLAVIAGFAVLVAAALFLVGPQAMDLLFGSDFHYDRGGLVLVGAGMGLYLASATLNQAALAQARAKQAAACWLAAAAAFTAFLLAVEWDDRVLQVEAGFAAAALLLCGALGALYRRGQA